MPFGGQHITEDLSQNLGLPLVEAERIKTLYASVAIAASDEHDLVLLARGPGDEAGTSSANRGQMCRIVRANYLIDAKSVSKVQGLPFTARELEDAIEGALK